MKREYCIKYLGILIDSHLSWKPQIDFVVKKIRRSIGILSKLRHYIEVLHASRDIIATVTMPPSCMPGQKKMAATQCERVPSLRGYRDSLSAENRQMYDEKLKFTAGIDPYAVSDNFYSQAMDEWPEIEFPDIVNYLLFSTSKFKPTVLPILRRWLGKKCICGKGYSRHDNFDRKGKENLLYMTPLKNTELF